MELTSQVTSLDLSRQLKAMGYKQDSLFYWWRLLPIEPFVLIHPTLDSRTLESYVNAYPSAEICSAYTVSELADELKKFKEKLKSPGEEWITYQAFQEFISNPNLIARVLIDLKQNHLIYMKNSKLKTMKCCAGTGTFGNCGRGTRKGCNGSHCKCMKKDCPEMHYVDCYKHYIHAELVK